MCHEASPPEKDIGDAHVRMHYVLVGNQAAVFSYVPNGDILCGLAHARDIFQLTHCI